MMSDSPIHHYHPHLSVREIWPGPDGYPWAESGAACWTREALLRRVGPGKLLASWTTGGFIEPWEGNHTMLRLSHDDGQTWQDAGCFRHAYGGLFASEIFSPREGELHAILMHYVTNGTWLTQLQNYRAISRDGGESWEGPSSLPGGIPGVWPNRGIRHSSGRWVIPVSWSELTGPQWVPPLVGQPKVQPQVGNRQPPSEVLPLGSQDALLFEYGEHWAADNHRFVCGALLSDDEGATFRLRGYLRGGLHGHLIEPRVVELSDGRMAMLIRSQRDGRLWRSESSDVGETWTDPIRTDIPNPGAKIGLLRASDGRICLLHNPVEFNGKVFGGRNPLALWISDDDMATWQAKVTLVKSQDPTGNVNYPDGFLDEEKGELVFVWEDAERVYLNRLPMDLT